MGCGVRTCSWLQGATTEPTHTPIKERALCKIPFSPHHTGYSNLFEMFGQVDKVKRISCFKVHSVLFFSFTISEEKHIFICSLVICFSYFAILISHACWSFFLLFY